MNKYCVVLVTCGNAKEAKRIAQSLLREKLAACVNIIPRADSIFYWNNKMSQERETMLLIKTRANLFTKLSTTVRKTHSYQVPEIIALPIIRGEDQYLDWLGKETTG